MLALEDVEVLAAAPVPPPAGQEADGERVRASLHVSVRDAVYLASAQSFARDVRLLVRAPGDRARGRAGLDDRRAPSLTPDAPALKGSGRSADPSL